jgi:hypothetical protein
MLDFFFRIEPATPVGSVLYRVGPTKADFTVTAWGSGLRSCIEYREKKYFICFIEIFLAKIFSAWQN